MTSSEVSDQKYGWALEIEGTITHQNTNQPVQEIRGQSPIEFIMEHLQGSIKDLVTPEELPFDIEFMNSIVHETPNQAISEAQQILEDINQQIDTYGIQVTLQPIPTEVFTFNEDFLSPRAKQLISISPAWRELLALTSVNSIQWNVSTQFKGLNREERLAVSADIYNQYNQNYHQIFSQFNLANHIGFNGKNRLDSIQILLQEACKDVFPQDLSQAIFPGPFRNINQLIEYALKKSQSSEISEGFINSKNMHSSSIKMQGPLTHYTEFNPFALEHRGFDSRENLEDMLPIANYIEKMNKTAISNIESYI